MLAATLAAAASTEIARQMGIARRGLDPRMAEQLADHGQTLTQRQGTRGKAVAQVMQAHILQPGPRPDDLP